MSNFYYFSRKIFSVAFIICLVSATSAQDYVKSDFQVSDSDEFYAQDLRMSASQGGEMFLSWGIAGQGELQYKAVSSQGMLISDQDTIDSPRSNMQGHVAHNNLGNCMALFQGHLSSWSVMVQTFDLLGDEFGESQVLDLSTSEQMNIYRSSVNANHLNQFGVCLPVTEGLLAVKLSDTGVQLPGEILLKPGPEFYADLYGMMTHEEEYILVWIDFSDGNIWGQKFTGEGVSIGDAFKVSDNGENNILASPIICSDTSGRFVVVWTVKINNGTDIYSQLFAPDGDRLGSNTLIREKYGPDNSTNISADMDETGKYIVAWQDTETDSLFIRLQQVGNNGNLVGDNFRATTINNLPEPGDNPLPLQQDPNVSLIRDTIYLAWTNYNPDLHHRYTIYANLQKWKNPDISGIHRADGKQRELKVYPNPAREFLLVKFPSELQGPGIIKIYTSTGSLLDQRKIQVSGQEIQLYLPGLGKGAYIMEAELGSVRLTELFILE